MTWRELWQTTVANLRALFRREDALTPPPLPGETASSAASTADSDAPGAPTFPAVWDDPSPELAAVLRTRVEAVSAPPQPMAAHPPVAHAAKEPADELERQTAAPVHPAGQAVESDAEAILDAVTMTDAGMEAASPAAHGEAVPAQVAATAPPEPPTAAPDAPAGERAVEDAPALSVVLESVLFVASEPVTPVQLARSLQVSEAEVQAGLAALADHYRSSGRGLQLQQLHGKVQLVTAPVVAMYVEAFLNLDATARLSGPALETLAVVAYRQPVTRAQVEAIRGVDCAGVLRSLVQRGLIVEVGRLESAGRPILYGVTELFMQHFGLADLSDLPPLEENEADRLWAATLLAEADGGLEAEPDISASPAASAPSGKDAGHEISEGG